MAYWRDKVDWRETDTNIEEGREYTKTELSDIADALLRHDARTELCRKCDETGSETGKIQDQEQFNEKGKPLKDEQGNALTLEFKEFSCPNGHRWYEGEGRVKGIGGDNPILFEEHFQSRKRREIMTSAGTPDPNIVSGIYNRCVDIETEALTREGWKGVDNLSIGEEIWAYQPDTKRKADAGTYQWQPLQEIFRNDEYSGSLFVLEGLRISARYTEGHKWLVANHEGSSKLEEVTELKGNHLIPLCLETRVVAPEILDSLGAWVVVKDVEHSPVSYEGTIWCPRVESGFWLARRNGKVFTTGNTHPQGRKVNSPESRKKFGASWYK